MRNPGSFVANSWSRALCHIQAAGLVFNRNLYREHIPESQSVLEKKDLTPAQKLYQASHSHLWLSNYTSGNKSGLNCSSSTLESGSFD